MPKLLMDITPLKLSPEFRRIWMGGLFSTMGFQITSTAILLEMFDLTHSTTAVGAVGLVAVIPLIIGGLYGGVIADTYDRRKVALTASIGMWLVTLCIALHAWLDLHSIWILYALIAIESLLQPINQAARGAIIPRLIKRRLLPSANALNMSVGTLGMSVGPMLGGALVAASGYKITYSINVLAMVVGLWALYKLPAMRPDHQGDAPSRGIKSVGEGFAFVRQESVVGMTFVIDLIGMIFAQAKPIIPALVLISFGGGDAGSGILLSAGAIGAFLGISFSGWVKGIERQGRFLTLSYFGWGTGFFLFGLCAYILQDRNPSESLTENIVPLLLGSAALAFAGWSDALGSIYRSTIIQEATPDHMRGRLQGMFIMTVVGGPNLGTGLIGAGASILGASVVAMSGGILCMVAITGATLLVPSLWKYIPEPIPETNMLPQVDEHAVNLDVPQNPGTGKINIITPEASAEYRKQK